MPDQWFSTNLLVKNRATLQFVKGDGQRRAILELLDEAADGAGTGPLAAALHLHPNTVRWHLAALSSDGLVVSEQSPAGGRGRPRLTYRLTPAGRSRGRDGYRVLAELLATTVEGTPGGLDQAYRAGELFGRRLQRAAPSARPEELLDREGFAATRCGDTIEMRSCPFFELARCNPAAVCTLHRGMVDGVLAAAGRGEHVRQIEAFVEPYLCVARLERD